ncbi:hypothetical protein CCR90_18465 [Rhodovulum sulfidophilum]|uniref:hypothetical protein n=1 Tax=Rhodovulum sulfidophilum TaxID=35806 RepID=UPI0019121130|nr:hypothetical protein [Rhodovulum sulfidophilum]MBK5925706.1 hypothetical protein [Rhodovulum sulfidophilum]
MARSPDFRFEVPGSGGGGKLPLWPFIAAGVAALLLVIGVGAYLFWPAGTAQVPGLSGLTLAAAEARLEAVVLAAAPRVTVDEDCIRHNPGNIAAKQIGGRWKIVDGSHWMMDFGTDADSAKKVLAVLKAYGADRICYVSRPQPPMMYILNGDSAPSATAATRQRLAAAGLGREDCIGFDPATLDLESGGAGVTLVSDRSRMIRFRNMDEAKKAMLVIRKHGFTRQCFVGRPNPEFKYFLR